MSRGISPTSSRKRVPRWASSNFPGFVVTAPVKAPFSYPKSSLSTRFSAMAAQLILMKGCSFRALCRWMARAISSLPVPVSPVMSTVVIAGETFRMIS